MPTAAIFARVSKKDVQDTANQLGQLRQWASGRGFEIVAEYVVEESAYTGAQRRQLEQVIRDGRRGRFRVLLVWALDRLSREGAEAILTLVRRLHEVGVRTLSYQEPWTEASGEMLELLLAIAGWQARVESQRKGERVKAALARRKAEGKPIGRQPGARDKRPRRRSGYVARWERERARRRGRAEGA